MLYKEAYTKVKFSSDLELRNEFKLFPCQLLKLKFLVSESFFCYYKIKTFALMNFLNIATLILHLSNVGSKIARFHF